ncbi:4Fe-4S binding protein [Clostridium sp.]|uniref:4Fe-4S binding protein n=1 Tax=Clostridium sp. TaxID=1506 RepID=UPI002F925DA7
MKKLPFMKRLEGPYSVKIADVKTGAWRKRRPVIDDVKCIKCGICVEDCPCGVIEINEKVTIDYAYCKGCGICVEECPKKAILFVAESNFKKGAGE